MFALGFVAVNLKSVWLNLHSNAHVIILVYNYIMSRDMTKPTKWLCAQSDQSLRCPHEESSGP